MSDQYYVDMGGRTGGPFSLQEVRKLYRGGTLSPDMLYSRPGAEDWLPLRTILPLLTEDTSPPKDETKLPDSPDELFQASRWTSGNLLFPSKALLTKKVLKWKKERFFGSKEMSISLAKIASVDIECGILFARVLVESSGGTDPLLMPGLWKKDAIRLKERIEEFQGAL